MSTEFSVRIATNLEVEDICSSTAFPYVAVIDLRRTPGRSAALPVEERVLKQLTKLFIPYTQLPTCLKNASSRCENELFNRICYYRGAVLVVTDDTVPMSHFCMGLDIPFSCGDQYRIETEINYVPVRPSFQRPISRAQFGSMSV